MRINNENLLDESGPLDLSEAQELPAVWLGHIINYSIQIVFSGTPAGTFKLQASNDPGRINSSESANQHPIEHWTDLDSTDVTVSAAGSHLWAFTNAGYNWVRVVFEPDMGSAGSLDSARANVKGV